MPADPKRVRDLFLAVAELPGRDRAAYLSANDGGDAELRAAVERLLIAHEQPASVLASSASGVANDAAQLPIAPQATVDSVPGQPETEHYGDPTARVGAILGGKYKLLQQIGEGGMGIVWMAEQHEPVRRLVALKVKIGRAHV